MRQRTSLLIFTAALLCASSCFALDWRSLHEAADRIDLRTALKCVEKDTRSVEDLYILGLVYLDMFQTRKAEEVFARIADLAPGTKEAVWGRAEVLRRYHQNDEAEDLLAGIVELHPEYSPAFLSLAYVRFAQARFHDAASSALAVVRRKEQDVDTTTYARALLIYAGAKGMIAHFGGPMSRIINGIIVMPTIQRAQMLKADSPEVLFGFGCYYLLAPRGLGKNIRLAKYYLERLVEDEPLFPDGFARLAQVYKVTGDIARYEQLLNTALDLDPKSELALDIKQNTCRFVCPAANGD
ncbi:MAG TPA: hypothetical protein PLP56_01080 [Candidatus Omnitrophota bacterium]|nr:hypothetical protein [Candidatus Omnitrophota bacterium]HNQ49817.1 hypothetical protein [Candidatus Omnitrophota bacterium]HQO38383.1 hypothetical protein [Candidatus Omnitrophota bacterium]HQQ05558.1 hypothetical protein [Candidatus Omnitrophota bacterium]